MQIRIPKKGYLGPFFIGKVPVLIHWTFPVGGLFVAWFLGDMTFKTIIPLALAYTTLVLIHEFGHALAAKMSGNKVQAVLITGSGGLCFADTPDSLTWRFLFYAGGIIAQLVVLIITSIYLFIFQSTGTIFFDLFAFVFTVVNAVFILINIIPSEHTDGNLLWNLFRNRKSEA
jgi:Zn-dependent protease